MSVNKNDNNSNGVSDILGTFFDYIKETTDLYDGCGVSNVNVRDYSGDSLLHYAIRFYDDQNVLSKLISLGLDVNTIGDMGNTPLHVGCACGNFDAVKVLVDHGARLDIVNEFIHTPIDIAFDRGFTQIYNYLHGHTKRT